MQRHSARMILKFGSIFVAVEADRISEKLQSYVKLLCVTILCSLRNKAYFNLFSQYVTGIRTAMTGEKASFRCANQESAKIN
jgi:hypothetical protein